MTRQTSQAEKVDMGKLHTPKNRHTENLDRWKRVGAEIPAAFRWTLFVLGYGPIYTKNLLISFKYMHF